jgi:hypothetical protein
VLIQPKGCSFKSASKEPKPKPLQVDVLITNGIHILAIVIIVDSICANFILRVASSRGMITMIATQAKVVSYCNRHLEDNFILLVIEMFECLHQHVDDFLHQCANMAWLAKGFRDPALSIIHSFYKHKVLVTL